MGCVNTSSSGGGAATPTAGRANSAASNAVAVDGKPLELVLPDPDLGWKRVPLNIKVPPHVAADSHADGDPFSKESGAAAQGGGGVRASGASSHPFAAANLKIAISSVPDTWKLTMYNDRSGKFARVLIPAMALNIGLRAAKLASQFGLSTAADGAAGGELQPGKDPLLEEDDYVPYSLGAGSRDFAALYKALGVPDYGWTLEQRDWAPQRRKKSASSARQSVETPYGLWGVKARGGATNGAGATGGTAGSAPSPAKMVEEAGPLQKMRSREGKVVLADCGSIGLNICEQLYRLERSKTPGGVNNPNDVYGWTLKAVVQESRTCVVVGSPDGGAYLVVPEELLMNVSSWVQDTYLTQSAF